MDMKLELSTAKHQLSKSGVLVKLDLPLVLYWMEVLSWMQDLNWTIKVWKR